MTLFTATTIITLLFLFAGGVMVASNRTVSAGSRRAFLIAIATIGVEATLTWIVNEIMRENHSDFTNFFITVYLSCTFAVLPCIPIMIANALLPNRHIRLTAIALGAHAALELSNIFLNSVFYIKDTLFYPGPLYFVYIAVYSAAIAYLVLESVRMARTYQFSNFLFLVALLVCMGSGIVIQVIFPRVYVTWTSVAMGLVLFFQLCADMVLRTDALTRLLNRHAYGEFMANPTLPCVVALVDVDDFKHVNDTYGHAYGDVCLSTIAGLMRSAYGSAGKCYRTGGDEFTVVLTRRLDQVDAMTDSLNRKLADVRARDERMPTVSVGCASAREGDDLDRVISEADATMYENKRSRKARR